MAFEVLAALNGLDTYQDSFASAYGIAAAQARYPLERRQWSAAAMLPIRTHKTFPWDKYPWHEAVTYFARGLGAARSQDGGAARDALQELNRFYKRSVQAGQDYWAVHVDVQRRTVAAWLDFSEGNKEQALEKMRAAADLEDSVDKHPVTPGAVLPARELLGDMLILAGRPEAAIQAYEISLQAAPNRFNSLFGAGLSAQLTGDFRKAEEYFTMLVQLADGSEGDRPRLVQARTFLSRN
jgi:tetratricopeptide (TPR) repeat protein